MLHFQMGTFKGISDDGFLMVDMQGPPQPVSTLGDQHEQPEQETSSTDTVNVPNKRKADEIFQTNTSKDAKENADASKDAKQNADPSNDVNEERLLPKDSEGVLYKTDGTIQVVDGPFDRSKLKQNIDCTYLQMVPFTKVGLEDKFALWMNEEGQYENELNKKATEIFGAQVFGGKLYGNILLVISNGVV
jgi:hypothetical protein